MLTLAIYLIAGAIAGHAAIRRGNVQGLRTISIWVLVVLVAVGQTRGDSRQLYPFVKWGMYSSASPARWYTDFLFVDSEGVHGRYPFSPLSSPWPTQERLNQVLSGCRCAEGSPLLDRTIQGLTKINFARTGRVIVRFEIVDIFPAVPGQTPDRQRRRYVWNAPNSGADHQSGASR